MRAKTKRIFGTVVALIVAVMMLVTTIIFAFPSLNY